MFSLPNFYISGISEYVQFSNKYTLFLLSKF